MGNKPHKLCIYSPEPRTKVYYFRLNFNISILSIKPLKGTNLGEAPALFHLY